jgi:hypothetical protein
MELARFINSHLEEIVAEFESFARSLEPASLGISVAQLRDHARQILTEVADDLVETESPAQKKAKSMGEAMVVLDETRGSGLTNIHEFAGPTELMYVC